MTSGLRNTIVGSFALAGLLNFIQISADFNNSAKAAFSPGWADAATIKTPSAQAAKSNATPAETLPSDSTSTPAPTAPPAAADPVIAAQAKLTAAGLKPEYAGLYLAAQARTGTPWQLIAAVHRVETGQRGDTAVTSYAGAVGPMQFMPATFRAYALDGDGNGTKTITDVDDAVFSAANYLRAGGADKGVYSTALYHYNHSNTYVNNVLAIARRLGL